MAAGCGLAFRRAWVNQATVSGRPSASDTRGVHSRSRTSQRRRVTPEASDHALAEEQAATGATDDAMVPAAKHEVTESELMMNSSTANASGKVQARRERAGKIAGTASDDRSVAVQSRSIAQDPMLMELMSAGW